MTTAQSQRLIFALLIGAIALTIVGDVASQRNKLVDVIPRRMVGGTIAAILLMSLAVPAPKLAVALGGLSAAGTLFLAPGGTTIVNTLTRITGANVPDDSPRNVSDFRPIAI